MSDANVIREYLVELGFKTDDKSLKNFTGGLEKASKAVVGLVARIEGAALAIGAGISAFASSLDGLYHQSKRTGAAATSLKAAQYAAKALGASAEDATGAIENLAAFMRNSPGSEGLLKSLGVQTRDANGNLLDTTEILTTLGQRLAKMPWYQAKAYANVFGISDNMLRAIQSGEFSGFMQDYRNLAQRSGLDKATQDAHGFMRSLREIGVSLESLGVQVQAALMQKMGPQLAKFGEWFQKNGPMIADRIAELVMMFLRLAEAAGPVLLAILDFFIRLDSATDGLSTKIIALAVAFKLLGGGAVLGALASLTAAFGKLAFGMGAAVLSGGKLAVILGRLGLIGAAGAGGWAIGSWLNGKINEWVEEKTGEKGQTLGGWIYDKLNPQQAEGQAQAPGGPSAPPSKRQAAALDFFQRMGWSKDQAAGLVANIKHESGFKHDAVGDRGKAYGIAQWHPDRQANFAKWAGKDIRQSTFEEQLAFMHYELTQGAEQRAGRLLRASNSARDAGAVVSRYYERPLAAQAEAEKRGAAAVQIAQTTNINVTGSGDPHATGRAVADEQQRVNAQMTRNMKGAVQ